MEHLSREEREHFTYCCAALVAAATAALLCGIDYAAVFIAMFLSMCYILISAPEERYNSND